MPLKKPISFFLSLAVLTFISWFLSKHIFYLKIYDNAFWGLSKQLQIHFNHYLFWSLTGTGALLLSIAFFFRQYANAIKRWSANKYLFSTVCIILLAASLAFYITGLNTPVFKSTRFYFFHNDVTLWDSIEAFFKSGETFLGIIILTFTIIFPITKYLFLFARVFLPQRAIIKVNHILSAISKLSMLDVFIVALVILNFKMESRIIDMELKNGVLYFALSVLLMMGVSIWMQYHRSSTTNISKN